ncbi:hypothetical protein [Sorangium sp. So ce1151]|uniref:hypothetical protein n=1 Tax=Sorangium sp. So ce1151 TaxID=3133332 RepID=UPI003F5D78F5
MSMMQALVRVLVLHRVMLRPRAGFSGRQELEPDLRDMERIGGRDPRQSRVRSG